MRELAELDKKSEKNKLIVGILNRTKNTHVWYVQDVYVLDSALLNN